jgi:lipoprotein signal peptidase
MLKGKDMISHFSPKKFYHTYFTFILIFLLFSLDQVTKFIIEATIPPGKILFSIYGFGITFKINKGFALHVFEQYESTIIVSIFHSIFLMLTGILAYRYYRTNF